MKPFLPFTRPSIDEQSIAAVADVFRSGQLASGPKVQAFEGALAAYLGGQRQVRVMTSATAGLEMALEVAGVGPGDEVIGRIGEITAGGPDYTKPCIQELIPSERPVPRLHLD